MKNIIIVLGILFLMVACKASSPPTVTDKKLEAGYVPIVGTNPSPSPSP